MYFNKYSLRCSITKNKNITDWRVKIVCLLSQRNINKNKLILKYFKLLTHSLPSPKKDYMFLSYFTIIIITDEYDTLKLV